MSSKMPEYPSFEVKLTNKILQSLLARNGFDDVWDSIDVLIQMEIKDELTGIIEREVDELMHEIWMDS